jgi:hypothetical protein
VLAIAVATATIGCASEDEPRMPAACNDSVPAIQAALAHAPGRVQLSRGVQLSTCVENARTGADIQTVGALYTATADALATRIARSDTAAMRLGFLVGASRRGASRTDGIHHELVRRLENSTGLAGAPAARQAAYRRGVAAGRDHG